MFFLALRLVSARKLSVLIFIFLELDFALKEVTNSQLVSNYNMSDSHSVHGLLTCIFMSG